MKCSYEFYLEEGMIPAARRVELLKAHLVHHADGTAVCSAFRRRASCSPSPSACRVCGATDCAKAECFRSILAAEENLAFREGLARHAGAAERDARLRRNGGASR